MSPIYYHPSGRFSPSALAYVALAILLIVPCAWLYAWSAIHLRSMVMAFVVIGYALLLFTACTSVAHLGKVRNPLLMTVLALVIGGFGWYCQWAQWAVLAGQDSGKAWPGLAAFLAHPSGVFGMPLAIKGSGPIAVLVALLEFLLLAIVPAWLVQGKAGQPFCETSHTWSEARKLARHFGPVDKAVIQQFIAAAEIDPGAVLKQLAVLQADPDRYTTLSVYQCDGASETYLSVHAVTRTVKDGKTSETRSCLLEYLHMAPQSARQLLEQADIAPVPDDEAPAPVELAAALACLHAEDFTAALAAAAPFCTSPERALRNDANRLCALSCARLGRWAEAAGYWEALFVHEETSHNAMQVATSSVMDGAVARGEQWFAKALEVNDTTGDTPQIHSYANFITALQMAGQLRAALPYLEWVRQVYQDLHITDATFLTLRGVPFFISFLDKSAPSVDASMDAAQAHAWYGAMLAHIDQDGQQTLNAWLAQRACA